MYCPKCGKEIEDSSTFCKFCGNKIEYNNKKNENEIKKEKWYKRKWILIIFLIISTPFLLFPIPLILMWKSDDVTQLFKKVTTGIFIFLTFLIILGTVSDEKTNEKQETIGKKSNKKMYKLVVKSQGKGKTSISGVNRFRKGKSIKITAMPSKGWRFDKWNGTKKQGKTIAIILNENKKIVAIFKEKLLDVSYFDIKSKVNDLTNAQWNNYAKKIIGKKVKWSGHVENVKKHAWSDKYKVWIDMDSVYDKLSVQDVYLNNIEKKVAMNLNKNEIINFIGRIENITTTLKVQIILKDVVVMK